MGRTKQMKNRLVTNTEKIYIYSTAKIIKSNVSIYATRLKWQH